MRVSIIYFYLTHLIRINVELLLKSQINNTCNKIKYLNEAVVEEEPEEGRAHPASIGDQGTTHLCFNDLIQRRALCAVVLFRELPVGGGGEKRKRNKEEIMAAGSG